MTKNEILDYLSNHWNDELKNKLEISIARYVVYQIDPDNDSTYCYKYYVSKDLAVRDFESRDYVASGCWCYCCISSFYDDYNLRRIISIDD